MFKRKSMSIMILLLSLLVLVGCVPSAGKTDADYVKEAIEAIELPESTTAALALETSISSNAVIVVVSWSSSHPQYISNTGVIQRPTHTVGDVDVTLTATFTRNEVTEVRTFVVTVLALDPVEFGVTFVSNGTTVGTVNVLEGGKVSQPTNPTGSAFFTFGGWYKDTNFTQPWSFTEDIVNSNMTLYAKWIEAPKFNVTFDPDNGEATSSLLVYQGSTLPTQTTPVKLGYTFTHWAMDDDTIWDFSSDTVTAAITLTAIYTPTEYAITYVYPADATVVTSGQLTYDIETPITTLSAVTKLHADFIGWFDAPTGGNAVTGYPIGTTGNITLYARFEDHVPFTVTLVDPKGTNLTQTKYLGEKADTVTNPNHLGYAFLGWFVNINDALPYDFDTAITADVTLTAKYQPIAYDISYVGGVNVSAWPLNYTIESSAVILPAVQREAYVFLGWFDAATEGNLVTEIPSGSTGNKTFYARYEAIIYTLEYQLDGGVLVGTNPATYTIETSTITLLNQTKEGYAFVGWFDAATEGNLVTEIPLGSSGNKAFYARYEEISFTLEYQLNGGALVGSNPATYTVESSTITLLNPTKTGYTFVGWFDAATEGNLVTEIPSGSTGNKTFYARYEAIIYTLEYQLDGGVLVGTNPATYTIETSTITLLNPTKEGYAFVGWFDAEVEGNLVTAIPLGSIGDMDLFARFSLILNIEYYGEIELATEDLKRSNTWPETFIALTEGQVFTRGGGEFGLLGNGDYVDVHSWINITSSFDLVEGDYIVEITLVDRQATARSAYGRLFVWGFISDDGMEIFTNEPIDVATLVEPEVLVITSVTPLGKGFIFTTASDMYLYVNNIISEITPNIPLNEQLSWTLPFGLTEIPGVLAFTTETSIYLFDPFDTLSFVDITTTLNLPEEDILVVFSQDFAIHIVTETLYTYAMFTGDEQMPLMMLQVPLDIVLLENEFVVKPFAGGGLFTSLNRILVPEYQMDEETEMPNAVTYVDITPDLGLPESEFVVNVHDPYFIETSLGRMLLVMVDESEGEQTIQAIDIDLASLLLPGETFIEFRMVGWDIYFVSNQRFAAVEYRQEGIALVNHTVQTLGIIHTLEIPQHLFEPDTYQPDSPLYQAFNGWFMDEALTIPLSSEHITADMSLYASYIYTHYFITIELYDGNPPTVIAFPMDEVPVNVPEDPTRDHQFFTGWYYYDDIEGYNEYDFTTPLNKDVTLFANFMQNQYEVTLVFEGMDNSVFQVSALTNLGDIEWVLPAGYEIIAIYMDDTMLIPYNPDDQLTGPTTFYVALDAMTIDIYYYHDMEEIAFDQVYSIGNQVFATTFDGRVFAWGDNYQGALGLGLDHIQFVNIPLDITSLFNLDLGEEIIAIEGLYSYKVALSSTGRVFAWGYWLSSGDTQSVVKDITPILNIQLGQSIQDIYTANSGVYFFMSDGEIKYFDYYEESVYAATTSLTLDVIYVEQVLYDSKQLFMITTDGAFIVEMIENGQPATITDLSTSLNGDTVFYTKINYQTYGQLYLYTEEGRIYVFDSIEFTITPVVDLILNPGELLLNAFIVAWDTMAFFTSEDRLIGYNTTVFEYDTSVLLENEQLLTWEYGYKFFTSLGRSIEVNMSTNVLTNPLDEFTLEMGDVVVRYLTVEWVMYAQLASMSYIQTGGTPWVESVGANLIIEAYSYGTTFELAEIIPKPGFEFQGWVDTYGNLYVEIPSNTVFLYPYFTEIPE